MDRNPLVAIVVLNFNGEACLPLLLESLQSLSYESRMIIIVDNDSQDDSFAVAKKALPEGIFLQNSENLGFAAGMNVGIREALKRSAQYVWLLNNDATVAPDTLSKLISFCESREDVGAVSPRIMTPEGQPWFTGGKISFLRMRASHVAGTSDETPYESEYLSGCALFIPSPVLRSVGLLDERYFLYYEDADLSFRITKAKKKLFVVPEALVWHAELSETRTPAKLYHLVYSGLLFFHTHSPLWFRPILAVIEALRRLKNYGDLLFRSKKARSVRLAYTDYDRKN